MPSWESEPSPTFPGVRADSQGRMDLNGIVARKG